jgi:transposase
VSRPTVIAWRERYEAGGIAALGDAARSGRPAEIDEIEVSGDAERGEGLALGGEVLSHRRAAGVADARHPTASLSV